MSRSKRRGVCSGKCAANRMKSLLLSERTDSPQQMTEMVLDDVSKCIAKYDKLEHGKIRCYATHSPSVLHIEIPVKKER